MNTNSTTSGRRRRSLVLVLSVLSVAVATGSAYSSAPTPVQPSQELVVLFRSHQARSGPSIHSARLVVVPLRMPITGARSVLPVLAHRGKWLKVLLPGRPNGHSGWIEKGATSRAVTPWHLVVDRGRRQLTVYKAGHSVRVIQVIVGKPSTPTPTGQFFVQESVALPADEPGAPFALALSASSDVLQEFDGGPGQIAVHGVDNVGGTPGTAVSHGCICLDTQAIRWLVQRIGPGVPVTIKG